MRSPGIVAAQPADLPGELGAAAVDPRFHRPLRQAQLIGDLLIRKFLDVPQQHGGAKRLGQRRHRLAEQHDTIALLEGGDRPGVRRGRREISRVDAAVDCGIVVNPGQALAQVQGGIVFGLSAALFHEITVQGGAVVQRSFPDYDMIRLANAPRVTVEFLVSDAPMGGLGEPGVPPIAPAVANAVFALTGQRLRSLPLRLS